MSLEDRWSAAQSAFLSFLDDLGANQEAHTVALLLYGREIRDQEEFLRHLEAHKGRDETWLFLTAMSEDGKSGYGLAATGKGWDPQAAFRLPFVEVHSRLVAWWLTYSWRARELAVATREHFDASEFIASASCGRALVETAAAFFSDARKLRASWSEIKEAGDLSNDREAFRRYQEIRAVLNEVQYGGKFDRRSPEAEGVFGQLRRANVLGAIDKLSKTVSDGFQSDYQWLCNAVHPSLGNTFAFSAPPLVHLAKTHGQVWFAGTPLVIEGPKSTVAERTVQDAIARNATISLEVLKATMDAALRFIDDLGLTTQAAETADFHYWRSGLSAARNEPCPCRSGDKAKRCVHDWGREVPSFPTTFVTQS